MKEDDREETGDSAVSGGMEESGFDGRSTRMGYGKIPVWVYTAKNGYAWQGLEEGEDRATAAALDKALAAAGRVGGAWGAVVRRPVASRRWAEWPRSRLCWVLFRFFPGAGRDQRGRSCNYTAAACIPAEDGRPRLDFGKLFAAPAMSVVGSEGLDRLWIDLDGDEDYLLRGPLLRLRREENVPEPSWEGSWDSPVLLREDALRTLSRWCQGKGVDAGDLKAVARTGEDGAGTLVVHATYAVYPQVAAALAAEDEWSAARTEGGAVARQALEKWHGALGALGELNRALGGLEGLSSLLEERQRALDEAEGAAMDEEQSARMAAAASASAEKAAEEIRRGMAGFRMAREAERGKSDNRRKLDELGRAIGEVRRKHGPGGRWNVLERELDELRQRVAKVEGCLDTVNAFQRAALAGGASAALDREAREAIALARDLGRWGRGTFAQDALAEMERMYRIGHAQSGGGSGAKVAPVTFGSGSEETDGERSGQHRYRHRHGEGARRPWWRQWWWWPAVGTVAVAAMLFVPWWMGRKAELKKWEVVRKEACGLAKEFKYPEALAKLDEIKPKWFLCLGANRYTKEFQRTWEQLNAAMDLTRAIEHEKVSKELLESKEIEKKDFAVKSEKAASDWAAYRNERNNTESKRHTIEFDDKNWPILDGKAVKDGELGKVTERYSEVAKGWREAAEKFDKACNKIDAVVAAENKLARAAEAQRQAAEEKQAAKQRKQAIMSGIATDLKKAQEEEGEAKAKLVGLETAKAGLKTLRGYAEGDWENYEYYRGLAAEDGGATIRFDKQDHLPYRETDGNRVYLEEKELRRLPDVYRTAARNWQLAATAFEKACKDIEGQIGEARENLSVLLQQTLDAGRLLSELESDKDRYTAVQDAAKNRKNRKILQDWNHYAEFDGKAEKQLDGIPWLQGTVQLPDVDKLGNGLLLDWYGKLKKACTYRENACKQLQFAYDAIDRERAEAERQAAEKAAKETDAPETSEGEDGQNDAFEAEERPFDETDAAEGGEATSEGTIQTEDAQTDETLQDGAGGGQSQSNDNTQSPEKTRPWWKFWGSEDAEKGAAQPDDVSATPANPPLPRRPKNTMEGEP